MIRCFKITLGKLIFPLLFSLVVFIHPASAYIGPGTAMLYFQIILGSVFTAMFFVRIYWAKFKAFLKKSLHLKENVNEI